MAFVVGVGLDGDTRANEFLEERPETCETLTGDLLELRLVLGHHPLVVFGGHRRQTLRQQVVEGVTTLHLDNFPLLAEMLDVVHKEKFDTTTLPLRKLTGMGAGRIHGPRAGGDGRGL